MYQCYTSIHKIGNFIKNLAGTVFVVAVGTIFLAGCAPGPIPSIFGPKRREDIIIIKMLLFVLVAALGYFIWHKITVIESRINSLEKEIKKLKKEKGGDHD